MSQHSIFGRIGQLTRANIHALLDQAEDPQKMVDQMIRDYTSAISDTEAAVATTIGNIRMVEEDLREEQAAAEQWAAKAAAASQKADDMRTAEEAEANRFDDLARVALRRQLDGEADIRELAMAIAEQSEVVERLKDGQNQMRDQLDQLRRKRNELVGRARPAAAARRVRDAIKSVDILDPASEISRFEEKIRREEARIRGLEELGASSLDGQFESLAPDTADAEVEARLAQLKSGVPATGV